MLPCLRMSHDYIILPTHPVSTQRERVTLYTSPTFEMNLSTLRGTLLVGKFPLIVARGYLGVYAVKRIREVESAVFNLGAW